MEPRVVAAATAAATHLATSSGLRVDRASVLHDSNKLALRLMPCDVVARVTHRDVEGAQDELDRARLLAAAGCPVGLVEPRVVPIVRTEGEFAVTLWTYYAPAAPQVGAVDYGEALRRLHTGMASSTMASPRFTDRVDEAEQVVDHPALSPELADPDRALLGSTLRNLRRRIVARGAVEQLLHGEPHPGNVLSTTDGPRFIDFETVCRGPVELDLAHAPAAVDEHYAGADRALLDDCRQLVLAMVASWRWSTGDQFPNRRRWGHELLRALREGPPWPSSDVLAQRVEGR